MELLNHIHRTQHLTILMVTHDPVIAKNATREVHMCDGSIVSDTGNTGAYADKTAGGNAS